MRKVVVGLGVLVILIVLGILVLPAFLEVNRYRPQIETRLREKLGRNVSLGEMHLSFNPLAFRVENVVIDEDPAFKTGRPFAQVQTLFVRPEFWPLLRREVQIDSLQLQQPKIEVVRNPQGVWNYASLMNRKAKDRPSTFTLGWLKIYDGEVGVTDLQQHKPRSVYDHIDVVLTGVAPEKPFSIEARAHVPGRDGESLVLAGKAGPVHDGITGTPFDGHLKLDGVSVAGLQRLANVQVVLGSEAVLTGSADVKNSGGMLTSKGKFDARDVRIHNIEIGYPVSVDYEVANDLNASTAYIKRANLKLGQTPVSLNGTINEAPNPAVVDLNVQASNASIAETARLAAAFGVAFNPKYDVKGDLNYNVHARGPVNKPVVEGRITARDLRVTGGDLREPVQADAIELALAPDSIRSNEFTAKTGRTAVTTQFNVLNYASDSPQFQAKLNTGNGELGELLRIAHAYGISAVEGVNGSGLVTLNVSAGGFLKDPGKMTYDGSGALRNASISSTSLAKPLEVHNADLRFSADSIVLDNLDASLGQTAAHGNMTVRNLTSPQVDFALSANKINLAEWHDLLSPESKAAPGQPAQMRTTRSSSPRQDNIFTRATGSGKLSADTVIYDQLVLNHMQSMVTLDHGIITMKPLNAGLFNGQEAGTVVMNARTRPISYTVDSKLQGVDANQLLSAISPVKQTLYGLLNANADAHFVTTSASAADIVRTLTGKVSLNLKNGKIANMDLVHQLATIGQFLQTPRAVEPSTELIQVNGNFDIANGVARTNDLKATLDAGSLAAAGVIDLVQQRLDLHLTAVLSRDYSESVGGTQIGGFLNTALANERGELVLPVIVTGAFQNPQFAPDLAKVAQLKLQNLLPSVSNPAQLGVGILGQVLRGKSGQPGHPPQDFLGPGGLEDIFGTILGGNKRKQQPPGR